MAGSLKKAPLWQLHRRAVAAADPAIGLINADSGVDTMDYKKVVCNAKFNGGTTTATLEILFHTTLGTPGWVLSSPTITFSLTANASFTFDPLGRRFYIRVSALGAGTSLDIEVAGADPRGEEFD